MNDGYPLMLNSHAERFIYAPPRPTHCG